MGQNPQRRQHCKALASAAGWEGYGVIRWLDRAALAATLLLPLFLMHGRGVAEALVGLIDLCFLLRCAALRDWRWTGQAWVRLAAAWWGWQVLCSMPGIGIGGVASLAQALAVARYLVLTAALQHAVLATPVARVWLQRVLTACTIYIAGQSLLQATIGRNLQGFPRSGDGELTGPFLHARAGMPLSRLIFPTLLPPLSRWLATGRWLAAVATAVLGVGTVVLIGQRMPVLLTLLGLLVTALLLPRLRGVLATATLAGAVLLAASVVVSPPTFYRLVTKFSTQMEHFADSDYGMIGGRALVIAGAHPVFGRGFDGFRNACADPVYFHPLAGSRADGGGAAACNIHPHNHYLEALVNAGIPGLLLFCALILVWLRDLGRRLWRNPDPLRVGLFVAALVQEWPIASASGFTAMEAGGFFFLMLGYGLALASTSPMSPSAGRPST